MPTLVKFFAPWCAHCSMMAPAYNSLARTVHGEWKGAQVGEVNCDAHPGNKFSKVLYTMTFKFDNILTFENFLQNSGTDTKSRATRPWRSLARASFTRTTDPKRRKPCSTSSRCVFTCMRVSARARACACQIHTYSWCSGECAGIPSTPQCEAASDTLPQHRSFRQWCPRRGLYSEKSPTLISYEILMNHVLKNQHPRIFMPT